MPSEPQPEITLREIGRSMLNAFAKSIHETRADLDEYRQTFPLWVAEHSTSGLASWINDRAWARLINRVDGFGGVNVVEVGTSRELLVGTEFRFRVKRHDKNGAIATAETKQSDAFYGLDLAKIALPGLEALCLTVGYVWDAEAHDIGEPVVVLHRKARDKPVWMSVIPSAEATPVMIDNAEDAHYFPIIESELGKSIAESNHQEGEPV